MITVKRIILGFLIVFFLSSLTRNFFEYRKNLEFYDGYKNNYEEAKRRNNELKSQLVKNNDPYQVEKTIRNKLNLAKQNEVAVLLPEPSPTPIIITPTPVPNHVQWYEVFFGSRQDN
jgi:cell division protein FtsB